MLRTQVRGREKGEIDYTGVPVRFMRTFGTSAPKLSTSADHFGLAVYSLIFDQVAGDIFSLLDIGDNFIRAFTLMELISNMVLTRM